MSEFSDWPRVRLTEPPCGPGLSLDETENALLTVCAALWADCRIPVVAWGDECDGTEIFPPVTQ